MTPLIGGRDVNEWRFVLQAPWGRVGISLAVAVALATVALSVVGSRDERRRSRRVILALLRSGAVACGLVIFAQPAIQLENVTRLPNRVAVIVDRSASMALSERPGAMSRDERAARLMEKGTPAFEAWRALHNVDFFTFGGPGAREEARTPPGRTSAPAAPDLQSSSLASLSHVDPKALLHGDATRLREALTALRARYEGHDLAGVLLLSDGIDNGRFSSQLRSADPAAHPDRADPALATTPVAGGAGNLLDAEARDFLRSLDTPVHTIWTAAPGLRDVAIARVLADDFAFARTVVRIEAVVRVLGGAAWRGRNLPVTLRRDGVVVRTVDLTVDPARPEQTVSFEFTPDRVGKFLYEVSVPLLDGDAVPQNNTRTFAIKVIRDKIRCLLVAGRPSWDERFLRGLLKHNPNVDLISFFILRTPTDVEAVSPDEMSLIPFPTEELFMQQLRSFDVVFLQNFNYGPYGINAYLQQIKDYVLEGGGLAMVGGDLSFTSGGYARSPVADVLPVDLLDPAPEDRLISMDNFKMRLSSEGRGHPITALRLEPQENLARWDALPPLEGANLVARTKPGATVLGVHPLLKGSDGKPLPILSAGEFGKGRSLALASDSSWRWGFGTAGQPEAEDARGHDYQRFWENAIRWLVRDPELRLLRLESDRAAYRAGERATLRVHAVDAEYRPARGLEVSISLGRVGGAAGQSAQLPPRTVTTDDNGDAQLELEPLPPGGYRANARVNASGDRGSAMAAANQDDEVFVVRGSGRELEDAEARDGLLRAIAESTGGSYLGSDPTVEALEYLSFQKPEVVRVNQHRDLELWSSWISLVAAALFLSIEWTLRRRAGLL